jgi:hypothetical protein
VGTSRQEVALGCSHVARLGVRLSQSDLVAARYWRGWSWSGAGLLLFLLFRLVGESRGSGRICYRVGGLSPVVHSCVSDGN